MPKAQSAKDLAWLSQWEFAHRGLHDGEHCIENSASAAEAAIAAGMAIECDIQRSRDNRPIVFHDWELSRLTDAEGLIEDFTAAELGALRLGQTGDRPLDLSAFLAAIAGRVPLLIEIKSKPDYDVAKSCELVSDALNGLGDNGYSGAHAVMSFDPQVSAWFAENDPGRVRGLVATDSLDLGFLGAWRAKGVLEQARPDFLALDIRDLPDEKAAAWRSEGKPLLSWTVRSPELRARALAHVDGLISEGDGLA
jgi:glycerophosphoryl diester phosphodiesterase